MYNVAIMKYRLYIDEVGNPGPKSSDDPRHRYLSLTGVIMDLSHVQAFVFPTLESIKQAFFGSHPDDPLILHRKELLTAKHPFQSLRDPETRADFDREILGLLNDAEYTVITLAIDKLEHRQKYRVWKYDPYHYCLSVLMERYLRWLEGVKALGDVMAESRGGSEDMRLKKSFRRLCSEGTDYVRANLFRRHLTSLELKVKPKKNNIAGLQLADLVAHPSFKSCLAIREGVEMKESFGKQIVEILVESKYYRSPAGKIEGYGRKWLP